MPFLSPISFPRRLPYWLLVGVSLCAPALSQEKPPGALPPEAQRQLEEQRYRQSELIRQQERERALRQQQEDAPDARLAPPPAAPTARLPSTETPCFPIHAIELEGPRAADFRWALAAADPADDPARGRCLGAAGIEIVMTRVQNAILERGYVTTRVLAAPQDLNTGRLALTLVPGTLAAMRIQAADPDRVTLWNAVPMRPGDLLQLRDIEQGLENLKRVPTAEADIQIEPATDAQPGQSDLRVSWSQALPWRVSASADDSGSQATGRYLGSATVSYDHWWTLNDLFYLSGNHALGSRSRHATRGLTAHYSVPLGYWLLGATASRNSYYQTVAGATQDYLYSGESGNAEARLSRVVWRDASRKTGAYGRLWQRNSKNFIDDTEVEVQRRRMSGWEAGLTHREFLGRGTLDANLSWRHGTGAWHALPAPEEAFGEGSSRPSILSADAQLAQPFTLAGQALRASTAWRAQWNRSPLVPQDRFSIGGRFTVRGFDGELTLSAERGWLVRNELAWALAPLAGELYLAVDGGHVGGPSARQLIGQNLIGSALGVRGGSHGLSWDWFVGRPLKKPEGFRTDGTTTAVSLNAAY